MFVVTSGQSASSGKDSIVAARKKERIWTVKVLQ